MKTSIVKVHRINKTRLLAKSIVKVQLEEQTCLCEVEEMLQSSLLDLECEDQLLGHIFKSFQPREALVSHPGN